MINVDGPSVRTLYLNRFIVTPASRYGQSFTILIKLKIFSKFLPSILL